MVDGINAGLMAMGMRTDTTAARLSLRGSVSRLSVMMVSSCIEVHRYRRVLIRKSAEMVTYMKVSDAELPLRSRCD